MHRTRRSIAALSVLALLLALPQVTAAGAASKGKGAKRRVWKNVDLPFTTSFRLPKGVNLVRAVAKVDGNSAAVVSLTNVNTARPRCYPVVTKTWSSIRTRKGVCEALTATDRPGALWRLDVGSAGQSQQFGPLITTSSGADRAKSVTLQFVKGPVKGFAGRLNLNKLSMPRYKMDETKDFFITSFDGTELHAELTRPKTKKKVPTIVVSSPYFAGDGPYSPDLIDDWGPRGYAILSVDVRGYNLSGGCVEVWGYNEQRDQKAIIDWVAKQRWSNDHVGMIGKSYVGTTTLEAAVQAPKALDAIIAVAPVATAYDDWHFGGVSSGEQLFSPAAYQAVYGASPEPGRSDPASSVINAANGFCDPTLAARASDPRAIYDAFYKERDFAARAKKIDAAVLYTHGYEDSNVKINVANEFLNRLRTPHLGLFGHWDHIWPPRADTEVLLLAWMDQYVKGKNLGLKRLPNAIVENNLGRERGFTKWPTPTARKVDLHLNFDKAKVGGRPKQTEARLLLDSTRATGDASLLRLTQRVRKNFEVGGTAQLALKGSLAGSTNGHVAAFLYHQFKNRKELITFGMFNLAHRKGHDRYEPVLPTETIRARLPFLTNDHVFKKGHTLVLEIRAAQPFDSSATSPSEPGVLTLESGKNGTRLIAPRLR